jgi:hypothetical protein
MQPRQAWIRPNERTTIPHHAVYLSVIEQARTLITGSEELTLGVGHAHYEPTHQHEGRGEELAFTTIDSWWDWLDGLTRPRKTLYVYCYRWTVAAALLNIQHALDARGWEVTTYVHGAPPVIIRARRGERRIALIDVQNYHPRPWRELEAVARSGAEDDSLEPPEEPETPAQLAARQARTTRAIMRQWMMMVTTHDLGRMGLTAPHQALNAWRHGRGGSSVLRHSWTRAHHLERDAYYGGRLELTHLGRWDGAVECWDVRSMYGWLMATEELPVRIVGQRERLELDQLEELLETHCATARVLLETEEPAYPRRGPDGVHYPVGTWWSTLTTPELRYALERGDVARIGETYWYERAPALRSFALELADLRAHYRESGERPYELAVKLLINSLYGKLGQLSHEWVDEEWKGDPRSMPEQVQVEHQVVERWRHRLGITQVSRRRGETSNSVPSIAAHITAAGRIAMWRLMRALEPARALYVDTDSLIVPAPAVGRLPQPEGVSGMGRLEREWEAPWIVIRSLKHYDAPGQRVSSGVPEGAEQLEDGRWRWRRTVGLDDALAAGWHGSTRRITEERSMEYRYKGRRMDDATGWLEPHRVEEPLDQVDLHELVRVPA